MMYMAKLMTQPIRNVLYAAKMAQDMDNVLQNLPIPESPSALIAEVRAEMNTAISNLKNLGMTKLNQAKEWTSLQAKADKSVAGCSHVQHKFNRDLLHFDRKGIGTSAARLNNMSKKNLEVVQKTATDLKEAATAAAKLLADKEVRRLVHEYELKVKMYKDAVNNVKKVYAKDGSGRAEVDYRCNAIDAKFDECMTLAKNIPKHIVKMGAKAPVPATVGACVTNPIYSAITLLINVCIVLNMIIRMTKLMTSIIEDIEYFFGFFDISKLESLSELRKLLAKMLKDLNDVAESAVEDQRNSLTPVYSLKYNKTTMKWEEDNLNGKIRGYKRPSKMTLSREEIEGVTVITDITIDSYEMYDDALGTHLIGESVDGYIYDDGSIKSVATASVSVTADGKHSIISLSDGRRITIDKVVGSGDVVKLNDGSIVNIV